MTRRWWLAPLTPIAAVLTIAAAPSSITMAAAHTKITDAATPTAIADPDVALARQISVAAGLVDDNKPADALAMLDPLLAATDTPIERGQIEALRSFALAKLQRIPEAHKAIELGVASSPAPSMLLLRQLFLLRAFDGDIAGASDTLQLIAASQPEGLSQLPTDVVNELLRAIKSDELRAYNTDFALVAADWSPPDMTVSDADWLRLRLVGNLAKRNRLEEARPIIEKILNPVVLVRLGIDRRYEKLWPMIEARLGPGADLADARYVDAAKARFDKEPKSTIARLGYAEALNIASREPEALVVADIAKTPSELTALSDREIWLVNLQAALMGDAGRIDEALARYQALNGTPIAGRPGLIGTIINEALFAASVDKPDRALAAAEIASANGDAMSDIGRLYLSQARTCALQQLGRKVEATKIAAPLIATPDANDEAYLGAMICLGRLDDAAKAITRRLGGDETRNEMLFQLQPFLIRDTTKLREAGLRAGLRTLKARPDVKAAFLKAGRDLPAAVSPPR
jgi:hypothetical protein